LPFQSLVSSSHAQNKEHTVILRLALVVLLPLLAAACADRPLPVATGPVRQLNPGHWMPGPNELTTPPAVPGRAGA